MADGITITNLLNELAAKNKEITWELKCCYSDGVDTTIFEIKLFQLPERKVVGRVTFQLETEKVILCKYKGVDLSNSDNIVDTLLDIINSTKKGTPAL